MKEEFKAKFQHLTYRPDRVNEMSDKQLIDTITIILQPNMEDYADNSKFFYWMDYAQELDDIALVNYNGNSVVDYLNKMMAQELSLSPKHHACVDVASTLETLKPTYKGVFKYE